MKKDDIIIMRPIRCDINGQAEENSVKITWVNITEDDIVRSLDWKFHDGHVEGVQDEKR